MSDASLSLSKVCVGTGEAPALGAKAASEQHGFAFGLPEIIGFHLTRLAGLAEPKPETKAGRLRPTWLRTAW